MARARERESDPDLLSLADLVPQDSLSQAVLGSATQAAGGWSVWRLANEGSPEEAALALLRDSAYHRRSPPFVTAYWQLNGLRWSGQGLRSARTKLGLARAARLISGKLELFELFVGDLQLDLAKLLPEEAEERASLLLEGARASALEREVPPELESRGSALWRRVRGLALAGDSEAAAASYRQLRELGEGERWGFDPGSDPWLERVIELVPDVRADAEQLRHGG
ncbi:MAG TPA: hypothetical protein DEA08_22350 [Planctomycetes bacterium]|nr:hypothetical protein [Planctomycetota bacterium]